MSGHVEHGLESKNPTPSPMAKTERPPPFEHADPAVAVLTPIVLGVLVTPAVYGAVDTLEAALVVARRSTPCLTLGDLVAAIHASRGT